MKRIIPVFILCTLLFFACDNDDEKMEYAKIYFPLATRADQNGIFLARFDYAKDTTFIIGAYCAGSILPTQDVRVAIGLAEDSLLNAQQQNVTVAGYNLLPAEAYEVLPADTVTTIKKGTERGDIKVKFHTSVLDPGKQYILPLYIKSTSYYEIAAKYNYLFFGIKIQQ